MIFTEFGGLCENVSSTTTGYCTGPCPLHPWVPTTVQTLGAGTLLTVMGVRHVFAPPPGAGPLFLLVWIVVLYLGWSMVTIPYLAWGGGLSTDYHRRSVITGTREF
ncbi:MAG: MFS transporter, partial [Polyangiaceae bacterium]